MKKILIVEDEPAYLKLLRDQLTKKGYLIIEAKDGKEGLASAIVEKPDLILLDIKMPVMDGMQMLKKLRTNKYGKKAEVIILTNIEPNEGILKKVLEDQPDCYLIKSDTPLAQLTKKISEILLA